FGHLARGERPAKSSAGAGPTPSDDEAPTRVVRRGRALSLRRRGDVLEVALHRAPCNEIGTITLTELEHLASYVQGGAEGARALLWHSELEPGFCAGADLRELSTGPVDRRRRRQSASASAREVRGVLDRIHAVFNVLDMAPITTVAARHGVVFGGGFELALTADVLVADKSARLC